MVQVPGPGESVDLRLLEDGETRLVKLGREPGIVVDLLDLGATIKRIEVPHGPGRRVNVALGHPTPEDYRRGSLFLGGTIGRFANRIADGSFDLDGYPVQLDTTDRGHHLHGEPRGYHRRPWVLGDVSPDEATLLMHSPDGDQGLPGALDVTARFRVSRTSLDIHLTAVSSATTVVNLTNHLYLNLDGEGAGSIDRHCLQVRADHYLPIDADGLPLGPTAEVAGTPLDFRQPTRLAGPMRSTHEQVTRARGIDHNYVLDSDGFRPVATLTSSSGGLRAVLETDQPGLQVYTGNFLDGTATTSNGRTLRQGDGIALEPQLFPNSPNEFAYPSPVLRPGSVYRSRIRWTFEMVP